MVSFLVIYVLYTYMTVVASRALHSLQSDQLAYLTRRNSLRAQLAQAGRLRRFRQLVAVGIEDQPVMMVGRRRFLAGEHHVAPSLRRGRDGSGLARGTAAGLAPIERTRLRERAPHVEPERERRAGRDLFRALGGREPFGIARIERRAVGIAQPWRSSLAFGYESRDFHPALEARIDQALRLEPLERPAIGFEMLRLAPHVGFPSHAEPGEILVDRRFEPWPAARPVDVLDAQQQPPAGRARHVKIEQRRERMPEMEIAVRARREAEGGRRHAIGSNDGRAVALGPRVFPGLAII